MVCKSRQHVTWHKKKKKEKVRNPTLAFGLGLLRGHIFCYNLWFWSVDLILVSCWLNRQKQKELNGKEQFNNKISLKLLIYGSKLAFNCQVNYTIFPEPELRKFTVPLESRDFQNTGQEHLSIFPES